MPEHRFENPQGADVEDQLWQKKLPGCPAAAQPQNHAGPAAPPGRLPAEIAPPAPPAALWHPGRQHQANIVVVRTRQKIKRVNV